MCNIQMHDTLKYSMPAFKPLASSEYSNSKTPVRAITTPAANSALSGLVWLTRRGPLVSRMGMRLVATLLLALALLLGLFSPAPVLAGDVGAGAQKAYTCLGCHGVKHYVNTYPTYHVPKIAGQHEPYLISALQAYRSKTRAHPSMQANAALLTDQDIEDIAAYFSSLAGKEPKKIPEKPGIEAAATCAACHGANGNSEQPTNPKLAGQYKSYIKQALLSYRSGERQNPIMSGFASALSDADINKLAEYFSSQKGTILTAPRN